MLAKALACDLGAHGIRMNAVEPGWVMTITGGIEIVIMVGLAFTGLASPGPGGFSLAPLNPGPVFYGLITFIVVLVLTVAILVYLRVTGREDWMRRAQLVFEQSGGGH